MSNTLTIRLLEDEEGVVHTRIPEVVEGEDLSDRLCVLGTAVLIFLNDTKVLEQYVKIAENELKRVSEQEDVQ